MVMDINHRKLSHEIIEFYDKLSSWELAVVKGTGHSLSHIHAVEILGVNGAMRMKELAEKMGITTGTLTVQIDKMVRSGLVMRQVPQTDRRAVLVTLTEAGEVIYQQHDELHHQLTKQLTMKMSDDERRCLLGLFERVNHEF